MIRWLTIVGALALFGVLSGWVLGFLLTAVSADYVVVPSNYTMLGARLGLFAGTILAACAMISRRPPPTVAQVARALLMVTALTVLVPCLGSAVLSALTRVPGIAPEYDQLAHPRRYILFLSLHYGWVAGVAIGTVVAGAYLWRRRATSQHEAVASAVLVS